MRSELIVNDLRSQTAWRTPACIVQPSTSDELRDLVQSLVNGNVSFAIRSGGHSPSPDAANIENGILVDLSAFQQIDYDPAISTVTVGTGLKWGDVYHSLDQHNVTVVGGRVLSVGVGGLILGSMLERFKS